MDKNPGGRGFNLGNVSYRVVGTILLVVAVLYCTTTSDTFEFTLGGPRGLTLRLHKPPGMQTAPVREPSDHLLKSTGQAPIVQLI
jgi:hypothetical protein